MRPLGRIVTAGIGAATAASLLTGVTTAYMLRPVTPAAAMADTSVPPLVRPAPAPVARVVPAVNRASVSTPRAIPVAATPSSQCAGSDRAWRIAKPGAIGGLVGAGLGAAGGAIAKGGSGAGKGALIGGLLGAATGAGYGAYQTHNDCGTILGNGFTNGVSTARPSTETALRPRAASDDITVYPAR
jgi:hypothetical protein